MCQAMQKIEYPKTRKVHQVDDYRGTKVEDPYRWLEDDHSEETRAWVEAQNEVTFAYLTELPQMAPLRARLTELWNYPRYGTPFHKKNRYFFFKNDGLQNQSVLYKQDSPTASPEVLLDSEPSLGQGNGGALDTPRYRLIGIDLRSPKRSAWKELRSRIGGRPGERLPHRREIRSPCHARRAQPRPAVFEDGSFLKNLELPVLGSVTSVSGEREDEEMFFAFQSFAFPSSSIPRPFTNTISRPAKRRCSALPRSPSTGELSSPSSSSIVPRTGRRFRCSSPTSAGSPSMARTPPILYGYGGFNISLTPSFSVSNLVWLELGGVYAQANLRGGGEYGETWHEAGMLAETRTSSTTSSPPPSS